MVKKQLNAKKKMLDAKQMAADLTKKHNELRRFLGKQLPELVAGAAERMKDANFSAQGFVINGSARPRWSKRIRESSRTQGKRILHLTGTLQNSVKARVEGICVVVGVDTGLVPYAQLLGEGGRVLQHVKPHHRKNPRGGKRIQVRGFARKLTFPARRYIGPSPDIFKSADRDAKVVFDKIFK